MLRTVELLDCSNKEVFVELVRGPHVDDMDRIHTPTIGCTIEKHSVVADVFIEVQVRL
jgi:hypothetical protein